MALIEKKIVVGSLQCNCHILVCQNTGQAVVVDPGDEPERIVIELAKIEKTLSMPLTLTHFLHTHAHFDHIGATARLKKQFPNCAIALHQDDLKIYENLKLQGEMFGVPQDDPEPIDSFLEDEELIRLGNYRIKVLHTPGHSPGGVSYLLDHSVLCGDSLFSGSIGRTDLWEGDLEQLKKSIKNRLFTLDDETRVCPGHGPESKVGIEKRTNPFF